MFAINVDFIFISKCVRYNNLTVLKTAYIIFIDFKNGVGHIIFVITTKI